MYWTYLHKYGYFVLMYAVVVLYVFTEKSLMLNDSDFSSSCHKKGKSILEEEEGRTRSSKHWSIWLRKYGGGEIIHHAYVMTMTVILSQSWNLCHFEIGLCSALEQMSLYFMIPNNKSKQNWPLSGGKVMSHSRSNSEQNHFCRGFHLPSANGPFLWIAIT